MESEKPNVEKPNVGGDDEKEEFEPLVHRVAGCHSGTPSNILINKKGQVLKPYKPVSNPTFNPEKDVKSISDPQDLIPVTLNELDFYAQMDESQDPDFIGMRKLAPKYFGSKIVKMSSEIDHLLLEDFTHGMKYPCVMDLKIGKNRYYPGRAAEKAKQDTIKYPCLQEFGFCIAGIKLCQPSSGEVTFHHMPKVTRKFTSEEVAEHIRMFLHCDKPSGRALRTVLTQGGEEVLKWASTQRSFLLRGSSLLFVYDAAGLTDDEVKLGARVGMIDFAHVFHSFGKEDTNYHTGMKNLVSVLYSGRLPEHM